MVHRKTVAVSEEYRIMAVTEQMADGGWAVVASVTQASPAGEKIIDMPVRDTRYATQDQAEEAGLQQARDRIERNVSHAA